jgi:GTPase SAR1 family protein
MPEMDAQDSTVYITVIGDNHCGKTSLIAAAASETFPESPPPVRSNFELRGLDEEGWGRTVFDDPRPVIMMMMMMMILAG